MMLNARTFQHFTNREYKINYWASIQQDTARQDPEVSPGVIFKAIVHQAVLGKGSLLKLDQFLRTPQGVWISGSSRKMAASDTTLMRALGSWRMEALRQALYGMHIGLRRRSQASTYLTSGRKVHLAIVDGSNLGGFWFSVLGFGGEVYHSVDAQPYAGRGHELEASRTLLLRAREYLGDGFASHLVYDGLMADRPDFALCREELRAHLVVKTREEESLYLIEDTKSLWSRMSRKELQRAGVEVVSGTDADRARSYEVYAQAGFVWEGLAYPLKLAWVREKHLKGKYAGQTLSFWVMTTDETLTAQELREIAHCRWAIENNGFKELSEQVGSKKAHIKDAHAKEALLLMWFMGMALLKAFEAWLKLLPQYLKWAIKKTKNLIAQCILLTIPNGEGLECGASP